MSVAGASPVVHRSGGVTALDQVVGVDDAARARPALDHRLRALAAAVGVDHRRGRAGGGAGGRVPDPGPRGRSVRQVVLDDLAVRPGRPVEGVGAALGDPHRIGRGDGVHQVEIAHPGERLADRRDPPAVGGNGPGVHPLTPGDLLEGPAARRQPVEVLLPGMLAAGGDEERVAARRELGAPHLELALGERRDLALEVREHQHGPAARHRPEGEGLAVRQPLQIPRRPAAGHQWPADPGLLLLVIDVAQGAGLEVQQRDPALLVVHGEHLHDPVLAVRAPPGAVHHGVLLDAVLHPADLDVLGADAAVHRHDPETPRRERLPHLGTGVLLGGLPALVHELHEARALRVRGVLPATGRRGASRPATPGCPPPSRPSAPESPGAGDRCGPGGARRGVRRVPLRSRTATTSSFCCAFSHSCCFVSSSSAATAAANWRVVRDAMSCSQRSPFSGAFAERPFVAKSTLLPSGRSRSWPIWPETANTARVPPAAVHTCSDPLRAPRRRVSRNGTDHVRARNEPHLVRCQLPEGRALPVHREPGIVVGEVFRLRVLMPAEIDLRPVRGPTHVARRQPEDAVAASEMIQGQAKAGIGVRGGQLRLGRELGAGQRGKDKKQRCFRECGNGPHDGLLSGSAGSGRWRDRTTPPPAR